MTTRIHQLRTERLLLRQWRDSDVAPFAEMSADPEVMAYFPATLSDKESAEHAARHRARIDQRGFGFWATERLSDGRFIGLIGLNRVDDLPIDEAVEVGWRLGRPFWNQGYATEAARACLAFAFDTLQEEKVIALTTVNNSRSQAVMQRLGMQDTGRNFDHPRVAEGSPLREHVLYRITRERYRER